MANPEIRAFGIEEAARYFNPLLDALRIEREAVRDLRLPIPEDIDKFGELVERQKKMLADREKIAIELLRSLALQHELNQDRTNDKGEIIINPFKEMVGQTGEKITKENFTIIKGFILREIDRKMIEESVRSKAAAEQYGRGR